MKKIFILLLFIAGTTQAQESRVQEKALQVMKEINTKLRNRSLYRDSIRWEAYEAELANINPANYSPDSLMVPYILTFYKFLREAGDMHSFYMGPIASTKMKQVQDSVPLPEVSLLDDHTGYIKVPQLMTSNPGLIVKYTDSLRSQIQHLDNKTEIRAWVVDLRNNGGGTMWPMIAGLNPLIPDGIAGYFIDDRSRSSIWKSMSRNPENVGNVKTIYKCRNPNSKIAVLFNERTASSGEMTIISFLGLPNVKTFGTPSAGFTTANQTIPLSNGGFLYLATSFSADRNKKIYKGRLQPEVLVPEERILEAARHWLSE